jgi:hypothetical protein
VSANGIFCKPSYQERFLKVESIGVVWSRTD